MEKKTSSVEWLFNEIAMPEYGEPPKWVMDILQQAKEMHREEIVDSYTNGMHQGQEVYFSDDKIKLDVNSINYCIILSEQYYNETYGSTKQD